jgi:hypothetical protein
VTHEARPINSYNVTRRVQIQTQKKHEKYGWVLMTMAKGNLNVLLTHLRTGNQRGSKKRVCVLGATSQEVTFPLPLQFRWKNQLTG